MPPPSAAHTEGTGVVIVGAGPTGLTAAVRLPDLGIATVVLDAPAAPTRQSRAALGGASALRAAGREAHRSAMPARGGVPARLELTDIPSRFPFALGVPQSTTEGVLLRRLAGLGGSVRREHRVDSVRRDGT